MWAVVHQVTEGLGLENVGIVQDERTKKIPVDHAFKTSVPNIYAIGYATNKQTMRLL